jgi:hypothetical protein
MERLAPCTVKRVAVLDPQPNGEHPAADGDCDDSQYEWEQVD